MILRSAAARSSARRARRAVTSRPILFFEPSPALEEFVADDVSRRIVVLAANRVGKTRQAAFKLAKFLIERPGARCRAVGPTNKQAWNVLARYLAQFLAGYLAEGSYWAEGRGFNAGNIAVLKNGSTCQIMSYEQAPDAHAGDEMDIVWLDEPPPEPIYTESLARTLSRNGAVWVTLTAVGRPVKWFRLIVEAEDSDWRVYRVRFNRANAPWYSAAQVAQFLKDMAAAPWTYAQRVEGAWEGVTDDRRLSAFDTRAILPLTVGPRQGWKPHLPVHLALASDYGEDAGHSVWLLFAWQVVSRDRWRPEIRIRVLGEWTNPKRMSDQAEALAVREMVRAAGFDLADLDWAVGDINSAGKSAGGRSLNESFEAIFAQMMGAETPTLTFRAARKGADSIDEGLIRANQLLSAASLQVSESCQRLVEACAHWQGKDDDLKHRIDALRYGITAILDEAKLDPARLAA